MSPWWPLPNWVQQGSFVEPVTPPGVDFDNSPAVCVQISAAWLPYVLGAMQQLMQPSSWTVADNAALNDVLANVTDLIAEVGNAVVCSCPVLRLHDCVLQISCDGGDTWVDATDWASGFQDCVAQHNAPTAPSNPRSDTTPQMACNLAGYLAAQVLQKAAAAQAANRAAANKENDLIASLIKDVFGNSAFMNGVIDAGYGLFVVSQSFPNTDLVTASTDAGLLTSMTEAIQSATASKGYVDASNFAQVAVNLAAISYPAASWVPTMLANFWTQLTLTTIQAMQAQGSLNSENCDSFDTPWCHYFDFTLNDGGWQLIPGQAGSWNSSTGWTSDVVPGDPPHVECYIYVDMGRSMNITEVQVQWASNSGATSGQPHEAGVQTAPGVAWACVDTIPFDHADGLPYWQSTGSLGCSARYPAIALIGASAGGGYVHVLGCQIRGTGVDPFPGIGTCVVGP